MTTPEGRLGMSGVLPLVWNLRAVIDRLFCVGWWYVQHAYIWHWYLLLCIFILFIAFVHSFSHLIIFFYLVSKNRRNGPRYQRVLALCAFLTGVVPKGLILRKMFVRCLCIFCIFFFFLSKFVCRTDFVVFEYFVV